MPGYAAPRVFEAATVPCPAPALHAPLGVLAAALAAAPLLLLVFLCRRRLRHGGVGEDSEARPSRNGGGGGTEGAMMFSMAESPARAPPGDVDSGGVIWRLLTRRYTRDAYYWEVALLAQRVLLVAAATFASSPLWRACVCTRALLTDLYSRVRPHAQWDPHARARRAPPRRYAAVLVCVVALAAQIHGAPLRPPPDADEAGRWGRLDMNRVQVAFAGRMRSVC